MGTGAIIKVLEISISLKDMDKVPVDLASLTYNVQRSAVPFFRQDASPKSETDRLTHTCSDNMFPLALPSNVTSANISSFGPIYIHYDGYPSRVGNLIATFCCETCPNIVNGIGSDTPFNSANGVGDFHIQFAAYLKDENTKQGEFIKRSRFMYPYQPPTASDNPRIGGVESVPQSSIELNVLPNANVKKTEKVPNMKVHDTDMDFDFVYTVMVYQRPELDYKTESAIRIIVNDSEAMTLAEFKDFCNKDR